MEIRKMPHPGLGEVRSLSDEELRERMECVADRCNAALLRLYVLQDECMRRSREVELAALRTVPMVEAVLV